MSDRGRGAFAVAERERLRADLVAAARDDPDVVGAAVVGSAARGALDRWSDVDLALQLRAGADEPAVVARWTAAVDARCGVADAWDLWSAGTRYRVLLLASSLQVDLSFFAEHEFRATDEGFALAFGSPGPPEPAPSPEVGDVVGLAWLHALHARAAIERGRPLQARLMLDGLVERVVVLLCLQHGLNPWHGRGADRLPPPVVRRLLAARIGGGDADDARRALRAAVALLLDAVGALDPPRAERLGRALAPLR